MFVRNFASFLVFIADGRTPSFPIPFFFVVVLQLLHINPLASLAYGKIHGHALGQL